MKIPTDPIYGRRLRPLMPRPFTSCSTNTCAFPTTAPTHCYSLQNPRIPAWILPLSGGIDYGGKRDKNGGGVPLVSSRWNPTPEQLQALEEMYRQGTRSPSAEEIQKITAKLRRFGKIEGKNVFYWFQNHKARDRQKQRRHLQCLFARKDNQISRPKQSGSSRRYSENGRPKKLAATSNCTTPSKYYDGRKVQELEQRNGNEEKEGIRGQENTYYPFAALKMSESGIRENQTLQLFPVRSNDLMSRVEEDSNEASRFVPNQFIEFLPTKH